MRRLVLISAACRLGPVGREMQAAVAADLRAGRTRRAMGAVAAGLLPRAGWIARAIGWSAGRRLIGDPIAAADLAATLEAEVGFDLALCRAAIQAPTLIIAGARDRFYSPALFEQTAALIPGSFLHLFAKGHLAVTANRKARAHIAGFLDWTPP